MNKQQDLAPIEPDQADSLVGQDLAEVPEHKWAPMLANMVAVLEALYRRRGMAEGEAFKLASDSAMALAEYFGGRVVYLPRGDRLKNALRDAEIFREFRGSANVDQLVEKYGLSAIRLYAIHAEQKALHLAKVQGRLFTEE